MTLSAAMIRKHWKILAQIVAFIAATISSFLMFNAQLSIVNDGWNVGLFVQFITAIIVVPITIYLEQHTTLTRRAWLLVGAVAIFIGLFFAFQMADSEWTCDYATHYHLIIGSTYTDDASAFVSANPHYATSCSDLIAAYASDTASIWKKTELTSHFLALSTLYTAVWVLGAFLLLAVVDTLANMKKGKRAR